MNILNVIQYYVPAIGGGVRVLRELSKQLSAKGHNITVFTTTALNNKGFMSIRKGERIRTGRRTLFDGNVRIVRFNPLIIPFFQYSLDIIKLGPLIPQMYLKILQDRIKYNVISATSLPYAHIYQTYLIAKKLKTPIVIIPETKPHFMPETSTKVIYSLKNANAVVARTSFERELLARYWGVPTENIHIIGNGVNIKAFTQGNGKAFREKYEIPENTLIIGFVGRLTHQKGFNDLIHTIPRVIEAVGDARYIIVGPSTMYSRDIVRKLDTKYRKHLIMTGAIYNTKTLADMYAATDIIVNPSMDDSFGMVFFEAWTSNKPVIGCPVGGIRDVIKDSVDGYFVQYGNIDALSSKIVYLLKNQDIREQMGRNGYLKVKKYYSWDVIASKWEQLYSSISKS